MHQKKIYHGEAKLDHKYFILINVIFGFQGGQINLPLPLVCNFDLSRAAEVTGLETGSRHNT